MNGNDVELRTRRGFLESGLALVAVGATVPSFLVRAAQALAGAPQPGSATSRPAAARDRILVVIQLAGGNDGLNTLVPFRADPYYRARPQLALKPDAVLKVSDEWGFHPQAAGLKSLFDDGKLCVVGSVGYPNPSRSHFRSMDVWHTASPDGRMHEGWLGRYFDCECRGQDPSDPMKAVALMEESPPALRGRVFAPVAFEDPDDLTLRPAVRGGNAQGAINRLNQPQDPAAKSPGDTTLDFLRRTALDARVSAERIRRAAGAKEFGAGLPRESFGQSLRMVSRMIAAELPTRVYYVSLGGFDTHSGQLARHARLMKQFGDALKAFVDDLAETDCLERTLVLSFSEFGRRVAENASGGTDHGEAAPMFLAGSRVKAGLIGPSPDLTKLHRGDVPYATDFRQVYATVLRNWLGADPRPILGASFAPLPLLRP